MSETAYSEGCIARADHEAVIAENQSLRQELEAARERIASSRRETLHAFGRGVGWFALTLAVGLPLVFVVWFSIFRGMAWGDRARRNAEREATVYVTRLHGAPLGVACGHFVEGDLRCAARLPGWNHLIVLTCDDDEPSANDGCEEVSP